MYAETWSRPLIGKVATRHPKASLLSALLALALACGPARSESLSEHGIALYLQGRLAEAQEALEHAEVKSPSDTLVLLYLAEVQVRQGRYRDAARVAHRVLDQSPCNSWALSVLGRTKGVVLGSWTPDPMGDRNNLRRAVECDPADGDAWSHVYDDAVRRGDSVREREALRAMARTGYLTPGLLAHVRWTLERLPPEALWVAQRRLHALAALALQQTEQLRTDVIVVNGASVVDETYRDRLQRLYRLPIPNRAAPVGPHGGGTWISEDVRLFSLWVEKTSAGQLGRPFAWSLAGAGVELEPAAPHGAELRGAYWLLTPPGADSGATSVQVDTAEVRGALQAMPRDSFQFYGSRDRDPKPLGELQGVVCPVLATALRLSQSLEAAGVQSDATAWRDWAAQFAGDAGLDSLRTAILADSLETDGALARAMYPPTQRKASTEDTLVFVEQLPEVVHRVPPAYPDEARKAGVEGTVMVQALIGKQGDVEEVYVTRSIPALDAAAATAVLEWRFKPARSKGEPVTVWVAVPVKFKLN